VELVETRKSKGGRPAAGLPYGPASNLCDVRYGAKTLHLF